MRFPLRPISGFAQMTAASLISTDWLADHIDKPDLRIIDASWYLPNANRDARTEFARAHIKGAQFFDIDAVSDATSPLPHMVPPKERFREEMRRLAIDDGGLVVIYDGSGVFSAPRVWWLFGVFGMRAHVLDGGMPKWVSEGRKTYSAINADQPAGKPDARQARPLTLAPNPGRVVSANDVAKASNDPGVLILDARAPERFRGEAAEPRAGLRAGHIPGSRNLHFKALLDEQNCFRPRDELRAIFSQTGVKDGVNIITSCGSGITAAILSLGLELAGFSGHALYDGSWAEWGADHSLPLETGAVC